MAEQTKVFPETGFGGAGRLVRERPVHTSPERVDVTMPTGPWLTDPVVGVVRSAVAVILDDATGYVDDLRLDAGYSSVSLSIRLDLIAPLPLDGRLVTASATSFGGDAVGGTSTGTARDADGAVLATMSQRAHVLGPLPGDRSPAAPAHVVPDDRPLRAQLGLRESAPGRLELPAGDFTSNSMGNVHGGIYIVLAELAAHSLVPGSGLHTVSIDTSYLRGRPTTEPTVFTAELVRRGRASAVIQVRSAGGDGRPATLSTVVLQR